MRYTYKGKTHREGLGTWDPSLVQNRTSPSDEAGGLLTISAAFEKARGWAKDHLRQKPTGGRPAARDRKIAEQAAHELEREAAKQTLGKLCDAYVEHLKASGRLSWAEVGKILKTHVKSPWPELTAKPAREVNSEDILRILGRVHKAGSRRQMGKLHAYLHAAYKRAMDASTSVTGSEAFGAFHVKTNPLAGMENEGKSRADKSPLKLAEMRRYWRILSESPDTSRSGPLKIHLLLCGARPAQLVRLKVEDVDLELGELTLFDAKGRRDEADPYHLPLLPNVAQLLQPVMQTACTNGPYIFSTDLGRTPMSPRTLATWAKDLVASAPETRTIQGFQLKRVRSGAATLLSEALVSKELRDALQSHGLTDTERQHYNGAEWRAPKRYVLNYLLYSVSQAEEARSRSADQDLLAPTAMNLAGMGEVFKETDAPQ
ncbi:tyrosine-type recombinase/integrase [Castellaniella sp. UC4442_H9]